MNFLVVRNETRLKEVGEELERDCVLPGALSKLLAIAGELPPRQIALFVNKLLLSRS